MLRPTIHTLISVAGICFLVLLAGCAESGLTPQQKAALTPADRVYEVRSEFEFLTRAGANYAKQPDCTPAVIVGCKDKVVVANFAKYVHAADDQLKAADTLVRSGTATPDQSENAIAGARSAVAALSAYVLVHGVR